MYFGEYKYGPYDKIIRRAMSSAMNLLLIGSFITAPASIVLLPNLSFAAPLPFPPEWMATIARNLNFSGKLSKKDIDTLIDKGKGGTKDLSYKRLISIIERIDELLAQQKSAYSIEITGFYISNNPPTVAITVTVIEQKTLKEVGAYKLGNAKHDIGPMKKTSLQDSVVDVTE